MPHAIIRKQFKTDYKSQESVFQISITVDICALGRFLVVRTDANVTYKSKTQKLAYIEQLHTGPKQAIIATELE
jgi:hypothetical protein